MARTKQTARKSTKGRDPVEHARRVRKKKTKVRQETLERRAERRTNEELELARAAAYGAIIADRKGYGEDVVREEAETGDSIRAQLKRDKYIDRYVNRVRRRHNQEYVRYGPRPPPMEWDIFNNDEEDVEDSDDSEDDSDSDDEGSSDQDTDDYHSDDQMSDEEGNGYLIESDPASSEAEEQEEESDWENAFDEPLIVEPLEVVLPVEEAASEEDEDEDQGMDVDNIEFYEVVEEEEEDPEEVIYFSDDSRESMSIHSDGDAPPPTPGNSSDSDAADGLA